MSETDEFIDALAPVVAALRSLGVGHFVGADEAPGAVMLLDGDLAVWLMSGAGLGQSTQSAGICGFVQVEGR